MLKKAENHITIFAMLIVSLALVKGASAQAPDNMETFFSKNYAGISIELNATRKTAPGGNIIIDLLISCTADGVYINYLNLSVYGYRHFKYGLEKTDLNATFVISERPLDYNYTNKTSYNVSVPEDVWDLTYAEIHLNYTIQLLHLVYNEAFPTTTVKNVIWEELENQLARLNASHQQLNNTYRQLNNSYCQLNNTYKQLNQTCWELNQNYTTLNQTYWELERNVAGLDATRNVAVVLGVTTAVCVATTIYTIMRKPKQYL